MQSSNKETERWIFRDISNATNQRSFVSSLIPRFPTGNTTPLLIPKERNFSVIGLAGIASTLIFDWAVRCRMTGTHLNYFIIEELPTLPLSDNFFHIVKHTVILNCKLPLFSSTLLFIAQHKKTVNKLLRSALTEHERIRVQSILNSLVAILFKINLNDFTWILQDCDYNICQESSYINFSPKSFWRIDKDKHPEHRLTVLSLIAFHDLQEKIASCGGDVEKGIEAFCNQNDGEGWMLPETLRLADYGLGHDERAKEHQPVREYFGPRFYDWQLAQSPEESWRECHLHARNLLGEAGYRRLLDEIEGKEPEKQPQKNLSMIAETPVKYIQKSLLDNYSRKSIFDLEE